MLLVMPPLLRLRKTPAASQHPACDFQVYLYIFPFTSNQAYFPSTKIHIQIIIPLVSLIMARPAPKDSLEAYKNLSPDSGYPTIIHPHFNPKISSHIPPDPIREEITPPRDRAFFADLEKKSLFSVGTPVDLTESIGTVLEGVQLSKLTPQQLDELALLVNERGVVFFRDQDIDTEGQVKLFEHYGILDKHPAQKVRLCL